MNGKDYIPDNVFIHEFPTELGRIETPLKVLNLFKNSEMVVNAVWDTGATFSSVSTRVVQALGLEQDSKSMNIGFAGAVESSSSICFAFPGNGRYAALVEASWLPDVKGVPDFIIGLDIILMGEMALRSHGEKTELTFTFDTSKFVDYLADDSLAVMRKMTAFQEKLRRTFAKNGAK